MPTTAGTDAPFISPPIPGLCARRRGACASAGTLRTHRLIAPDQQHAAESASNPERGARRLERSGISRLSHESDPARAGAEVAYREATARISTWAGGRPPTGRKEDTRQAKRLGSHRRAQLPDGEQNCRIVRTVSSSGKGLPDLRRLLRSSPDPSLPSASSPSDRGRDPGGRRSPSTVQLATAGRRPA